jgi:hypothetical protein
MAVVLVITAVGAELPPAMRQGAVLNDEIGCGAGWHLDRKGRRSIAVRNVPIPDRFDEVGNGGGGPDAPRKAVGKDLFVAPVVWLQLPLRKTDNLSRYHEKSSILRQEPAKTPPKLSATPHSALPHLKVLRGFSSSLLLPLKHLPRHRSGMTCQRACAAGRHAYTAMTEHLFQAALAIERAVTAD